MPWRIASAERSRPGALPYQTPVTPSKRGPAVGLSPSPQAALAPGGHVEHQSQPGAESSSSPGRASLRDPKTLRVHPKNTEVVPSIGDAEREMLRADIRANGITTPLVILPDGQVLCGRERLQIALELGLALVPVLVKSDLQDEAAVLVEIVSDNLRRKRFTQAQRVRQVMALEPTVRDAARKSDPVPGSPVKSDGPAERARKQLADLAGMSTGNLSKAFALLRAGDTGDAPIAVLYERGVLRLDPVCNAAKELSPAEQQDFCAATLALPPDEQTHYAQERLRELHQRRPVLARVEAPKLSPPVSVSVTVQPAIRKPMQPQEPAASANVRATCGEPMQIGLPWGPGPAEGVTGKAGPSAGTEVPAEAPTAHEDAAARAPVTEPVEPTKAKTRRRAAAPPKDTTDTIRSVHQHLLEVVEIAKDPVKVALAAAGLDAIGKNMAAMVLGNFKIVAELGRVLSQPRRPQ